MIVLCCCLLAASWSSCFVIAIFSFSFSSPPSSSSGPSNYYSWDTNVVGWWSWSLSKRITPSRVVRGDTQAQTNHISVFNQSVSTSHLSSLLNDILSYVHCPVLGWSSWLIAWSAAPPSLGYHCSSSSSSISSTIERILMPGTPQMNCLRVPAVTLLLPLDQKYPFERIPSPSVCLL